MSIAPSHPVHTLVLALALAFVLSSTTLQSRVLAQSADTAATSTDDDAARGRFDAGLAFYEAGRFEEALPEFEAAWELSRRPEMLVNIANAAERSLRYARAVEALEQYLTLVPDADNRDAVERQLVRDRTAAERVATPDEGGGETTDTSETSDSASSPLPLIGWVTLGAGAAFGVVALVTGLVSHATFTDLEDACPADMCPPARASDIDGGRTLATVSSVFTVAAAVAGAVGLVLVIVGASDGDHASDASRSPANARVAVLPGLGSATVRVRF